MASTSSQSRGRNGKILVNSPMPKRDVFGSPKATPRTGTEYQAELPCIIERSDYMSSSRNYGATHAEAIDPNQDIIELPITLMRMNNDGLEKHLNKTSKNSVKEEKEMKFCDDFVPGSIVQIWSESEKASFVLGLYIFHKNFFELQHFVETKNTGDVMVFYYGEFYRSDEYFRWSQRRKTGCKRRFVLGKKFFSGLRQQELISRLVETVTEECKTTLLKVSETFLNKNMTLSGRLLSLKSVVGINLLVEAIAIGKDKKDLTRAAVDFSGSRKANPPALKQALPRKPCRSLTVSEIIETLNGDCRLSKARSSELFWEAVWPRLIERGWTADEVEPGKGDRSNGLNLSLIYLVPGAKNVPRNDLLKGEHYFDSATGVLGRVSREPGLILLPSDGPAGGGGNGPEEGGDDAVKYTVVDTSAGGKLVEARRLPCETDMDDCLGYRERVDSENEETHLENETDPIDCEPGFQSPKSGSGRKGKNRRHKAPASKNNRRETSEVILLAGPEMRSGPVPPEARDERLFSGPSGEGSSKGRAAGPACSLENTHWPLPFDLNELPQSEPDEDDRPAMVDQDPDVNPDRVRQSGRSLHILAMAMENLVHEMENRKRNGKTDREDEGSSRRPSRRTRAGAGPNGSTSSSEGSGPKVI